MRKKKIEDLPPPSCDTCFYSKLHSNQDVWCMRYPKHTVKYKVHWCGEYMDRIIAQDLGHRRGE